MKLWSGRFNKETDRAVNDFNSSIAFDQRFFEEDILGSIAHVKMLAEQGIIPKEDANVIKAELKNILEDIKTEKITFDPDAEDIHMFIETVLTQRIGPVGKKLHTGRSRNDQVATDMRLYIRKEIKSIREMLISFEYTLLNIIKAHTDTIMPGYTHLQKGQPITLSHHLGAYFEMFKRDIDRLDDTYRRTNVMPLGAGALATTTYPLNRQLTKELLGFYDICQNSIDAVSDRDYLIELLNNFSIMMMHLSRFSEEIILWCSNEFGFIELDDAYSTGSSIMPQKKNPDIAELVRGKTGRVYGSLMSMLTTMKGIPLAYNKDMQEDKQVTFDAIDTVKLCIPIFMDMLSTMKVNKAKMLKGAKGGFTNATDAADYLVKKGIPFRDAHEIIGKLVFYCIEHEKSLDDLTLEEYQQVSSVFDESIYHAIDLVTCVDQRNVIGGPSRAAMEHFIQISETYLKKL